MAYGNKTSLKRAIVEYLKKESEVGQNWVSREIDDIILAVDEKPFKVKNAANELLQAGELARNGAAYSLGPVQQFLVSKEIEARKNSRLLTLIPETISKDDPDYLERAFIDAFELAQLIDPLLVPGPHVSNVDGTTTIAVFRGTHLFRGSEDLREAISSMSFVAFVEHLARLILRGSVGVSAADSVAAYNKLLREKANVRVFVKVETNFTARQKNMAITFNVVPEKPSDAQSIIPMLMTHQQWKGNLFAHFFLNSQLSSEAFEIFREQAQQYLKHLTDIDDQLRLLLEFGPIQM